MGDPADGVPVPSQDLNGPAMPDFMQKYGEERAKRLRDDGINQYINPLQSDKWRHILEDPAVKAGTPVNRPVPNGGHSKVVIFGCGFGGLLMAVHLIQAGMPVEDILMIDKAGGFGGTWWWNRYPGLMCDVESYIYLPLLEETGYMPKRKYSSGLEIREYVDKIVERYGLLPRAMFQSSGKSAQWNDKTNEWDLQILEQPKGGAPTTISIKADFIMFASGVLNNAQLPALPGMDDFKGHMFHTARWDYNYTGGTQEKPELTGLEGKRVAFIGTGATGVQAVPELAKYAKDLYVFQRTPSSIDVRDNKDTDPVEWKEQIAAKKGWQKERNDNFNAFVNNIPSKPEKNLVNDGWTNAAAYSALIGTPKEVTMENVADHVQNLHALDYPRTEKIRQRAEQTVKDPATAKMLQAWYPTWCKRPCFHDEYLPTFNKPNVHLVDTDGKGVDKITANGIVVQGTEYEVDLIILGTGFVSPFLKSAAGKADIAVTGRNGTSLEERNDQGQVATIHGIATPDFPNMFWPGPLQGPVTANQSFVLDIMSTHIAYVVTQGLKKASGKVVIEPSNEGAEAWSNLIMSQAITFAAMQGCTPGYMNREGEADKTPPEAMMVAARNSVWGNGIKSFQDHVEAWRAKGDMEGFQVTAAA